jgi:hypothetical protein
MLIRDIYMVDKNVRIYDMDGSYQEIGADDAIDLLGWLLQQKERLLHIMREETKRLQRREEHGE